MSETAGNTSLTALPLFCFGTLMDARVLSLVTAQPVHSLCIRPAIAPGHVQREVIGESFPVLLRQPGAEAVGALVDGLGAAAMDRVLFFEGDDYALAPLQVTVAGQFVAACHFRDANTYRTGEQVWSFEHWQRHSRSAFVQQARRYMQHYGHLSRQEADAHW